MRLLTGVMLGVLSGCTQASLVPLFDSQQLSAAKPDARALARCQAEAQGYPPYDGPLRMGSKYDQSKSSKDTLDKAAAREYQKQVDAIYSYLGFLGQITEYMRKPSAAIRAAARDCFNLALSPWAEQQALAQSAASKQGEAVRKWFLSALAINMMKAEALTDWQMTSAQRDWLALLADRVQAYASPRRQRMDLYNNHDYWSSWAVMGAALVLDDPERLEWAEQGYWLAIGQITPRNGGVVLPLEAARGKRAGEYHAFALTPLILMAEAGTRNGLTLYEGDGKQLHALAEEVVHFWAQDGKGVQFPQKQVAIDDHKMAWWPVYAHRFPDRLPLPADEGERFGSRFTGGSLAGLWGESR